MENGWLLELKPCAAWLVEAVAQTEERTGVVCGRDFDLALVRNDRVLSYTADATGQAQELAQLEILDATIAARISAFLSEPTHELAAAVLPDEQRAVVVLPAVGDLGGEGVLLLPRADKATVGRVLDRAFGGEVRWLTDPPISRGVRKAMCEGALEQLVQSGLRVLDRRIGAARALPVRDRRTMSLYLYALQDMLCLFLDGALPSETPRPFPIAYLFRGTICPAHAAWMVLCFVMGQRRLLPSKRYPLRAVADHERLLPMIEIAAGNRTRLPDEWRECARMAEHLGMFFDVRRTRHSILVRLCPLVPASAREFAVRVPSAIELWKNPPVDHGLLP